MVRTLCGMSLFGRLLLAFLIAVTAFVAVPYGLMGSRILSFWHALPLLIMVPGLAARVWLQARMRRHSVAAHVRCGRCGYDLTGHAEVLGATGAARPECGGRFDEVPPVAAGTPHPAELARLQMRLQLTSAVVVTALFAAALGIPVAMGNLRDYTVPGVVFGIAIAGAWPPVIQHRRRLRGDGTPKRH